MSNPTTLVFPITNSLDGTDQSGSVSLTGVDPIRYNNGLWLEEGTTNLLLNPSAENAVITTGIGAIGTGASLSRDTSAAIDGTASARIQGNGSGANQGVAFSTATGLGGSARQFTGSLYLRGTATLRSYIRAAHTDATLEDGTDVTEVCAGEFAREITNSKTSNAGKTLDYLQLHSRTNSAQVCDFLADGAQIEEKSYATSLAVGSMGAGYAFTGTAHNSSSTRAASSASVATASHIDPATGSLAFRFTRKIDTGGTETILECGTAGSGTDYLSIYVNSSDKLVVSWNSDNAGAQTVTSTDSIAVDTEYLVITKWNGTSVSLSLNVGTPDTGTRAAAQGSWGAGALTLEASAGGAIFNGLLVANRRTTQREDAALYNRATWSARTLRDRIAIGAMQLRPIGA